jgi:hypothetical protein
MPSAFGAIDKRIRIFYDLFVKNMEDKFMEINDNIKKVEFKNKILRKLPEWFGVEESLLEYVNSVNKYPFWAAFKNEPPQGKPCGIDKIVRCLMCVTYSALSKYADCS